MTNLGGRIQILRKELKLTQAQLANQIEVSSTQLVRYENKDVQPPADVLKRLADLFNVSIDFLVNGDTDEKANQSLQDNDLLMQFRKVEKLNDDDKSTVKKLLEAFLFKSNIQQQLTA
jgi:transcriptional regulator with XRE-family HTH domain